MVDKPQQPLYSDRYKQENNYTEEIKMRNNEFTLANAVARYLDRIAADVAARGTWSEERGTYVK